MVLQQGMINETNEQFQKEGEQLVLIVKLNNEKAAGKITSPITILRIHKIYERLSTIYIYYTIYIYIYIYIIY